MFKKNRIFLATITLLITVGTPLCQAMTFNDVEAAHTNYLAIEYLVSTGTLQGYSDNTFKPDQTINRAELMKVLVAGQGIDPDASVYQSCFSDVGTEWFAKYICYAQAQGWVAGYPDGTFKPAQTVNKVEAAKMVVNAYGLSPIDTPSEGHIFYTFSDVSTNDWFFAYVMALAEVGVVEKTGNVYSPSDGMTRGSVAEYIFRVLVSNENDEEIYTQAHRDEFLDNAGLSSLLTGAPYIVTVFYDGKVTRVESDEYVEIGNAGTTTVNLEGYTIVGSKSFELYTFPSVELAPNQTIKVYTNQGDYSFKSEDALWNNDGETASLFDPEGTLLDSFTW